MKASLTHAKHVFGTNYPYDHLPGQILEDIQMDVQDSVGRSKALFATVGLWVSGSIMRP